MIRVFQTAAFSSVLCAMLMIACSRPSPGPTAPPVFYQGRVSIENNSGVSIRILGYTQVRGDRSAQAQLSVHIFSGQTFHFHNLIDEGGGLIFAGGDRVIVRYEADVADPDDPTQPLFRNTVEVVVNGSFRIWVKSGGDFGISPE